MTEDVPLNPTLRKSMALVGWGRIQDALARLAESPVTRERCRTLLPEDTFESARRLLDETAAMVALLDSPDGFPLQPFEDPTPVIRDAEERLLIEPPACLALGKLLHLVRDVKRCLQRQNPPTPLTGYGAALDPLPALLNEIDRCVDSNGEIRENASPELKQAYRDLASARQALGSAVQKLMSQSPYRDALQDAYFTEREGRLVFPIRVEARSKIEGIVHDSSGTGQTLFMEPIQILPLNNQVKIAQMAVDREIARVLGLLARQILDAREPLQNNLDLLAALDQIHARARLARHMQARNYTFHRNGPVKLLHARNPELVLEGREVVPNDLAWDANIRAIIISGPNTGGKTVTLKTIGLSALMARAGLFLPVAEHSEISFFPEVYADIGDDQSLQLDLSTFSAHLEKIVYILNHASSGALVLLDELGIATDPEEGAALAESILLEMRRRGFLTLVSTHYPSIKILAQTEDGFVNACTEFDLESLKPTYRLVFGAPGQSAALETAERLGLDPATIAQARALYAKKDTRAQSLLQDLSRQKLKLESDRQELERLLEETRRLKVEQNRLAEKMKREEKELVRAKAKNIQSHVREAKQEIRKIMQEIKETRDRSKLRKAERRIHQMGQTPLGALTHHPEDWSVPVNQLKEGDPVLVEDYGALGVLLEAPQGKTQVRVKLGNFETRLESRRLFGSSGRRPPVKKPAAPTIKIHTEVHSHPQTTCDLRGMRVDEARDALELFLSQAVVNKVSRATIIHGHGMGKIKQTVRDYLMSSGIGKSFAPGERHEGGDGVTVVTF